MSKRSRREFLATTAVAGLAGLAGCSDETADGDGPSSNGSGTGSWRGYGGDALNSWSRQSRGAVTGELSELWSFETESTPAVVSSVVNGQVFVGSGDRIYAISEGGGEANWEQSFSAGGAIWPTAADGTVYTGTGDGYVRAYSASDGSEEWSVEVPVRGGFPGTAVAGGTVYVVSGNVRGYDTDDGELTESIPVPEALGPGLPAATDESVYVYSQKYVRSLATAKEGNSWRHEKEYDRFQSVSVGDGHVYAVEVGDRQGRLVAVDRANGSQQWAFESEEQLYAPVIGNQRVYTVTRNGEIIALSVDSGEEQWRYESGEFFRPSLFGDIIYGVTTQEIFGVDATTGDREFVHSLGETDQTTFPVVADGRLYVGVDNSVRAYDSSTA